MKNILKELSRGQKGHWGIVEPLHREPKGSVFIDFLNNQGGTEILIIDCSSGFREPVTSGTDSDAALVDHFRIQIENAMATAFRNEKRRLCCVIINFHKLIVEQQRKLLSMTRGLRESSMDLALQTIVYGAWNRYRLFDAWRADSTTSPCPDQGRIWASDGMDLDDLTDYLIQNGWVSLSRNDIDDIVIQAFGEFTGFDLFFIEEVLSALRMQGLNLRDFPEIRDDVAHSEIAHEHLGIRMRYLAPSARELLWRVIDGHQYSVEVRDANLEDLRLAGLVLLERFGGIVIAKIASPLVDAALRVGGGKITPCLESLDSGDDIVRPSHVFNGYAYRLVLEIETFLRNWIVTTLNEIEGDGWRTKVAGAKVPGCDSEAISDEIRILGDKLFESLHPELNLADLVPVVVAGDGRDDVPKSRGKRAMVGVIDSALDWRGRWEAHPAVQLSDSALPSFLTTGALMNIYMLKGVVAALVENWFGSREDAKVFFTRFNAIRSAVAHNQSLGASAIEELVMLRKDLCVRLSSSRKKANNPASL